MAWTQSDIDALKAALKTNTLSVRHGETSITYRSQGEMLKLLDIMEAEVNGASLTRRRTVASYRGGY
jgi:hypothetical protein